VDALLVLLDEFRCLGDELRHLTHAEFQYLMVCILALEMAMVRQEQPGPVPEQSESATSNAEEPSAPA